MPKSILGTEIIAVNNTEFPSSLHASGKNDDFERCYNLFVNTVFDCWQNVSSDASAMGSHWHNLMIFINCTTEGSTSYTVWASLDIQIPNTSALSPMLQMACLRGMVDHLEFPRSYKIMCYRKMFWDDTCFQKIARVKCQYRNTDFWCNL